ncbi:ABC transporter substrate-binding protein [Piscinibacter sp.]|uniref:ABC transporter substrate-binding protein n=1 Tax=Piscinibacter sp. TaxID=1903157 RepID=UPI002BDC1EDB|nr:ABC transporter substrate-binding protein [Albitalea sp.]HUG23682.1 ABC transporter substrate-binding protein [Albitalea sp.]
MKRLGKTVVHGMVAATAFAAFVAQAATIRVACSGVGQEFELCKGAAQAWAKKTGNEVQIVTPPNDASERLALYQQLLSAGSDKIDVLQIDVVWPGLLGNHLLDLKPHAKGAEKAHLEGFIANNTNDDRLVAMPWFANAGLLFYRKDLLQKYNEEVPMTWDDLTAVAKKVQDGERAFGNDKMWGYVWQGRAYEGLTCDALEWVVSYNGGTIVDKDGTVSIKNQNAAKALQTAASWVGSISPTAVLNYAEEEARGVFQAGNAVFMRNWPYAWSLAQGDDSVIKGKVGVAMLPKGGTGGRNAATLGGESLAVSKYSKNAVAAADLVMYMTSAAVQKERAIKGSFNPTIVALYKDAEIITANPFMGELHGTFTSAVGRPTTVTGPRYNQVSNQFWNAAHEVLSGKAEADEALGRLEQSLTRLGRGGKWH